MSGPLAFFSRVKDVFTFDLMPRTAEGPILKINFPRLEEIKAATHGHRPGLGPAGVNSAAAGTDQKIGYLPGFKYSGRLFQGIPLADGSKVKIQCGIRNIQPDRAVAAWLLYQVQGEEPR